MLSTVLGISTSRPFPSTIVRVWEASCSAAVVSVDGVASVATVVSTEVVVSPAFLVPQAVRPNTRTIASNAAKVFFIFIFFSFLFQFPDVFVRDFVPIISIQIRLLKPPRGIFCSEKSCEHSYHIVISFSYTCSRNINFLSTGHAPVFHRSYPHSPQVSPQDKLWKSLLFPAFFGKL